MAVSVQYIIVNWWLLLPLLQQLTSELDGMDNILTNDAVRPDEYQEAERMFDNISSTFKQFIVQAKDWIGNAKNLVRFCLLVAEVFPAVLEVLCV